MCATVRIAHRQVEPKFFFCLSFIWWAHFVKRISRQYTALNFITFFDYELNRSFTFCFVSAFFFQQKQHIVDVIRNDRLFNCYFLHLYIEFFVFDSLSYTSSLSEPQDLFYIQMAIFIPFLFFSHFLPSFASILCSLCYNLWFNVFDC